MVPEERTRLMTVSNSNIRFGVQAMLSLFPVMTLLMDAARVIEIRLRMMALKLYGRCRLRGS
jgi:hypothetical protein